MYLLSVFLLYFTISCTIANNVNILTDWKKTTFQCMNNFFENMKYFTYDTNFTIFGLDEKGGMYIYFFNKM